MRNPGEGTILKYYLILNCVYHRASRKTEEKCTKIQKNLKSLQNSIWITDAAIQYAHTFLFHSSHFNRKILWHFMENSFCFIFRYASTVLDILIHGIHHRTGYSHSFFFSLCVNEQWLEWTSAIDFMCDACNILIHSKERHSTVNEKKVVWCFSC